jgi:hypothetical protein
LSAILDREDLKQRADYTHKFNTKTGRHGWLRLTPAYSLKIVEEIVVNHDEARRIFDPFCGTGTTALSAAYHGHEGVTTDINPFLLWLATAKTAQYTADQIDAAKTAGEQALDLVATQAVEPAPTPALFNIERWWGPSALLYLRTLRAAIDVVSPKPGTSRSLLLVAFCRTLIDLSNASFNHQSMSFKEAQTADLHLETDFRAIFWRDFGFVLDGAKENLHGKGVVLHGDSRDSAAYVKGPFELVVTSPPYANRMSYIRELRPYMYWLGFLSDAREAGELDWTAIGGTWGIATSRLTEWERSVGHFRSEHLTGALNAISHSDNANGPLLSNYVAKYFDDMWSHFQRLTPVLATGAELHYVVGNSTFYGTLVSTERLYAEMLSELGFKHVECKPIRKRNSKKELIEFDVVARWR